MKVYDMLYCSNIHLRTFRKDLNQFPIEYKQKNVKFKDQARKWRKNDVQRTLPLHVETQIQFQFVVKDSPKVCSKPFKPKTALKVIVLKIFNFSKYSFQVLSWEWHFCDVSGRLDGALAPRAHLQLGIGMVKMYAKFEN
jgi:hypothetical protein